MQGSDADGVPNFMSRMQYNNFGQFDFFNLNPKLELSACQWRYALHAEFCPLQPQPIQQP